MHFRPGKSGQASVEKRRKALVRVKNAENSPADKKQPAYTFGKFRLQPDGTLLRGEKHVQLADGELAALRLLLEKRGTVVTHAQLSAAMGRTALGDAENVAETIASLRKRLGTEVHIQPVPKRGFRFTSDAHELTGSPHAGLPHVAVLPLLAEFGVAEYLGTAVTEGVIDRLIRRRSIVCTLAAKESVATLAHRGLSALEIGRAMKADMVLTGALRALPAHHRMRAEMIQVEDGRPLWTEDMLVDRTQLAGLEAQLAQLVAMRLEGDEVSIAASTEQEVEEQEPHNREAYELYQRARFEWQSLERHRMQDAVQHLTRASELDPSLSAARVDLAHLAITEAFHGYLSPAIAADMVRRAARPGFDDGPGGEAILPALGWVGFHYDRDLRAALDAFERSSHLPHDSWVSRARVMLALSRWRFDEAAAIISDALIVDPFSTWLHARRAWTHHMMGDAAASMREAKAALVQFPLHEGVEMYAGIILAFNGEADRAVELAGALAHRRPYFDPAIAVHAYTLAVAGRRDEARAILERLEWMGRERYVMNSLSAAVYVALGENDSALAELRAANEARCPWFFQALADPRLAPLHKLPEFRELEQILVNMERVAGKD
jgi:DNA-binding winged helix-turn-helix (wHTH) protein/tetratricopeptide (TPR) repeat protein